MIEPVFGQTKFNRGIDRFHRRGRAAVRTEWRLITATHNLLKLHRHTLAPTASLRSRPAHGRGAPPQPTRATPPTSRLTRAADSLRDSLAC